MDESLKRELDSFIEEFLEYPPVKRFVELKKAIRENDELMNLEQKIKKYQKLTALSIHKKDEYEQNRSKYLELKQRYDEHPLVVNFQIESQEVSLLLEKLRDALK